jgi:hypothetical protein
MASGDEGGMAHLRSSLGAVLRQLDRQNHHVAAAYVALAIELVETPDAHLQFGSLDPDAPWQAS